MNAPDELLNVSAAVAAARSAVLAGTTEFTPGGPVDVALRAAHLHLWTAEAKVYDARKLAAAEAVARP